MADASIDLQGTNIFGFGANFKTQSSGINVVTTNPANQDKDGNVSCERIIEDITNYTQSVTYCGTDIDTDLGALVSDFGEVVVSAALGIDILPTSITVNMSAGEYATIDIEGHQHDTNAHDQGDLLTVTLSGILGGFDLSAWDGFGVTSYPLSATTGTNCSPSSQTITYVLEHTDATDEEGKHLVGQNTSARVDISSDWIGVGGASFDSLSEIEAALEVFFGAGVVFVDSYDLSDSNSDFDTFSYVAHYNTALS